MPRADGVQVPFLGQIPAVFVGGLKVVTVLNQFGTERRHGGILFGIIAHGDNHCRRQANFAGGEGDTLAVITPGCRNHRADLGLIP